MALHFSREEFAARQAGTIAALEAQRLDGLLMFRQESMYYLTGYDTTGYSQFQCLYLGADGRPVLLTRSADLRQARITSVIEEIRIWIDRGDADPGQELRALLLELGCGGKRLGIELEAYCLTARRWRMVQAALDGFCTLVDASDLVSRLRAVKSPAELAYVYRAAQLGDEALREAQRLAVPGVSTGEILAGMHGVIFRGGGDYPASRFIIGRGEEALLVRNHAGHSQLQPDDQLQLEFGAACRHYHACLMRTVLTGNVDPRHRAMHAACVEALAACQQACRPGAVFADVFAAHARVLDGAGFREHRLNACGYSLGAAYPPTWMDWPMFYAGNTVPIQPGMVLFMHMILLDSDHGLAMALGETVEVTEAGCRSLSKMPHDLVVNG